MSEEMLDNTEEPIEDPSQEEDSTPELDALKAQADELGIKYHPNIGLKTLKGKIIASLQERLEDISENDPQAISEEELMRMGSKTEPYNMEGLRPATSDEILYRRKREASQLIRIRVTCMNPNKKNWPGEIISVGSSRMGTFKKYIPFNNAAGWHTPRCIVEEMRQRKCSAFYSVNGRDGQSIKRSRQVPEFSIEELPPLTPEQLKELARKQASANSIEAGFGPQF